MSRKTPKYNLNDIKAAAKKGNINLNQTYGNVQRDALTLGYDFEEVKKCILSLSEDGFVNTQEYKEGRYKLVCDEYLLSYYNPSNHIDDLYIKIRYTSTWITIMSFHLQRIG